MIISPQISSLAEYFQHWWAFVGYDMGVCGVAPRKIDQFWPIWDNFTLVWISLKVYTITGCPCVPMPVLLYIIFERLRKSNFWILTHMKSFMHIYVPHNNYSATAISTYQHWIMRWYRGRVQPGGGWSLVPSSSSSRICKVKSVQKIVMEYFNLY